MSFPQALVAEWGLLTLIVVGALTAVALACGAVALLGGGGGEFRMERNTLSATGIGMLAALFLAGTHSPSFLTVASSTGTVGFAMAIAALGIAASPRQRPAQALPRRHRPRSSQALIVAACIPVVAGILVAHAVLSPIVARRVQATSRVSLTAISQPMQDATVAMEDGHFYAHHGFDWAAMHRALRRDLRDGRIEQGGSTITQQVAKNLFLNNRRTVWRKIVEAAYTAELEHDLSKRRILELYLNAVDYGMGQHGVSAAARYYFHKSPSQLTVAESACLVGMVPGPTHGQLDLQRVADGEQAALGRMAFFFPRRYPQAATDEEMSIPLDRLVYPFKDAWDRGATETIPSTWHDVGFYFFADPDEPSDIDNVAACLKPELAGFLDEARHRCRLTGIDHLGVYNDRPMRQSQTALSAHAFGQAIDISGFRFADGGRLSVRDHGRPDVARRLAVMEGLLKRHFDIVVDWRDDPLRHQTHFHCEVRGPRPTAARDAVAPAAEVAGDLGRSANLASRYAAWSSGANVRKAHPMSCGPAALATVLTYYLHSPTTEEAAMRGAGTDGRDGTGLDQLQQAAAAAGFSARVVQIDTALLLQQLAKSDVPVLVLVFVPDGHFVDVVGRAGDNLLVSDPDSGSKAMTVGDFTKIWRGDALIVNPKS